MLAAWISLGVIGYLVAGFLVAKLWIVTFGVSKANKDSDMILAFWAWPFHVVVLIIVGAVALWHACKAFPLWIRDGKWPEDWVPPPSI